MKNPVPQIIYSNQPSMLVLVDGDPILQPMSDTSFSRVINTQAIILLHTTSHTFI